MKTINSEMWGLVATTLSALSAAGAVETALKGDYVRAAFSTMGAVMSGLTVITVVANSVKDAIDELRRDIVKQRNEQDRNGLVRGPTP